MQDAPEGGGGMPLGWWERPCLTFEPTPAGENLSAFQKLSLVISWLALPRQTIAWLGKALRNQ